MSEDSKGLYDKFTVIDNRTGAQHTGRKHFVMFFDDPECKAALETYALTVADRNPALANDILSEINGEISDCFHCTWVEEYRFRDADCESALQDHIAELKANQKEDCIDIYDPGCENVVARAVRVVEDGYGGSYDEPGYPCTDLYRLLTIKEIEDDLRAVQAEVSE